MHMMMTTTKINMVMVSRDNMITMVGPTMMVVTDCTDNGKDKDSGNGVMTAMVRIMKLTVMLTMPMIIRMIMKTLLTTTMFVMMITTVLMRMMTLIMMVMTTVMTLMTLTNT